MEKYHQLTYSQRCQIFAFLQMNLSKKEIANRLDVHRSTIYREISRNSFNEKYKPRAHFLYLNRRKNSRRRTVLTGQTKAMISEKVILDWSPEQISGRLKLTGELTISHETVYKYIYEDKESGGILYTHLRGKHKSRRKYGTYGRFKQRKEHSISKRSDEVNNRESIGHWEIDTVVSKKNKHAIVTLVDRKARYTLITKTKDLKTDTVMRATRRCLKVNKVIVKSITSDNGVEFTGFKRLINWFNIDYYFCHPYSSWERGTNENTNGLIRQYCPKGSSFKNVTAAEVKQIQNKINSRPRKILGFLTAEEYYNKEVCRT